jgi:hypothetical protein
MKYYIPTIMLCWATILLTSSALPSDEDGIEMLEISSFVPAHRHDNEQDQELFARATRASAADVEYFISKITSYLDDVENEHAFCFALITTCESAIEFKNVLEVNAEFIARLCQRNVELSEQASNDSARKEKSASALKVLEERNAHLLCNVVEYLEKNNFDSSCFPL